MTSPTLTSAKTVNDKILTGPPIVFVIMTLFCAPYVQHIKKNRQNKQWLSAMPQFCHSFSGYFPSIFAV
jgi:hypothetical protein